ncbi:1742_t:CDS:2, partial [Paraglomus brasilianum]
VSVLRHVEVKLEEMMGKVISGTRRPDGWSAAYLFFRPKLRRSCYYDNAIAATYNNYSYIRQTQLHPQNNNANSTTQQGAASTTTLWLHIRLHMQRGYSIVTSYSYKRPQFISLPSNSMPPGSINITKSDALTREQKAANLNRRSTSNDDKDERAHDSMADLDKLVKKTGKDYKKQTKRDNRLPLNPMNTEIAQKRKEYTIQLTQREKRANSTIAQIVCRLAEAQFASFNDSLKKCGPNERMGPIRWRKHASSPRIK